ncbi:peptidoglycan editing factor PgeF [Vibrio sp. 10N.222.51.C8]|uniref:peptidoglycan editing factor PgeF n=1 Tax=unclassified Vibrio TaxID=2614977 RepID=UPI00080E4355|nr:MULTISPECIES: peptidoglycan editing factor PgeF [unclassified Vibrio]MCC4889474.1 peptidoglycan editing factor PgeF [Vibrio sp. F13]OCH52079.1 multi-copper polyphenol oxidoreductase [Vibrio sp. ZF57]PMK16449.1 multi-copper polyphenol oxidoreductase [Vibrio sp. 10N.261.54.C3]PML66757.1 multi-copper polyphenol oxidoreductase [Vibrio sp. 10N.261.51.A7]PMN98113.1 multi-copper polyphenol oxidoreductase [Vibrio sp. 10N.222.55.F9]
MSMIIPNWNAPKNVKAFASTRFDGFSTGAYQGLNLGTHVGDDASLVENNRAWLKQHANMPAAPVWLHQTHSTDVVTVLHPTADILDADGAFTTAKDVVCSAMTADCLPVILTDTKGTQVAAVHAGWRGLAGGILENAVAKFSNLGSENKIIAWLGPAIGKQAFEVGDDVLEAFVSFDSQAKLAFEAKAEPGKWLANMSQLATQRLNKVGVTSVTDSNLCTFADADAFYSYRRDGITGRQATFIWLE